MSVPCLENTKCELMLIFTNSIKDFTFRVFEYSFHCAKSKQKSVFEKYLHQGSKSITGQIWQYKDFPPITSAAYHNLASFQLPSLEKWELLKCLRLAHCHHDSGHPKSLSRRESHKPDHMTERNREQKSVHENTEHGFLPKVAQGPLWINSDSKPKHTKGFKALITQQVMTSKQQNGSLHISAQTPSKRSPPRKKNLSPDVGIITTTYQRGQLENISVQTDVNPRNTEAKITQW